MQIGLDTGALNVPSPQVVQQAIQWADEESGRGKFPRIDASNVYICSHSAGIVTVRPACDCVFASGPIDHALHDIADIQSVGAPCQRSILTARVCMCVANRAHSQSLVWGGGGGGGDGFSDLDHR